MSGPNYPPQTAPPPLGPPPACKFTGSISGTTLTVKQIVSGAIVPGQILSDDTGNIAVGTSIVSFMGGTGGLGTYIVSIAQTVLTESMITSPLFDIWATIQAQFANSPIITQLCQNFFQYLDQTANINAWYANVWNILTAQGYGLEVWGRIVGVVRVLQVAASVNFGFSGPDGGSGDSWDAAPFYNGATLTNNFSLSNHDFRTLILAKALANISDGSIPSINQLLLNLFPGLGNCYVTDNQNMTVTYTFNFPLTPVQQAIIQQSGVLPTPCGCNFSVAITGQTPTGLPFANFDQQVPRGYTQPIANRTFLRGAGIPGGTLPSGSGRA